MNNSVNVRSLRIGLFALFSFYIYIYIYIYIYKQNKKTPKDVKRLFFNRIVVLAIFEPIPVVFGPWE